MLLRLDLDPANVDTDGLADGITGAGPWDAADFVTTDVPDGLAHQLNLTSAANLSAINFTLTGTDADDRAQVEVVAGPNATTVETTKYFKTLTDVEASATLGVNTLDIGFVDEFVSPTIALDFLRNASSKFFLDVTGTINVDVQFTICDLGDRAHYADQEAYKWVEPAAALTAETADSSAIVEVGAGYTGFRVQVNSYTDTAELQLYATQPER
jgi:hypothetical protein